MEQEKKPKKCIYCGKRYVRQQEWKTEREKELCLTCSAFDELSNQVLVNLRKVARELGLDFHFSVEIKPIKTHKN